jgi:hypothetical protein
VPPPASSSARSHSTSATSFTAHTALHTTMIMDSRRRFVR